MCILLGAQHFLTCFGSTVMIPLILAPAFCLGNDEKGNLVKFRDLRTFIYKFSTIISRHDWANQTVHRSLIKSYFISTIFVGVGICTLLQTTFGNRLPLLQGFDRTYSLAPLVTMFSLRYQNFWSINRWNIFIFNSNFCTDGIGSFSMLECCWVT